MTHTDPKPGNYSYKSRLASAEQNLVLDAIRNSPDIRGGTYTLAAPLILNGPYLTVGENLLYTSRSTTRVWLPISAANAGSGWGWNVTSQCWQTTSTTATTLFFDLPSLPLAGTVTSIGAWFKGDPGHAGSPATLPVVTFYKRARNSASPSTIGTLTDTYGSAGAYETSHLIEITGLTELIDKTANVYSFSVRSEGSTNARADAILSAISATITITAQSEWEP